MKRAAAVVAAAATIVLTGCAAEVDELRVTIDGVTVVAEQATSTEAQRDGLSGRDAVPEGTGMWFPINPAQQTEVWMQDTRVPLDVVWIRDGHSTSSRGERSPCSLGYLTFPFDRRMPADSTFLDLCATTRRS